MGMTIGALARRAGLATSTVRFYEREGVLSAPLRTAAGYRIYTAHSLAELGFIRSARSLGFSLCEIREVLTLARRGAAPCDRLKELAVKRLAVMDRELVKLRAQRKELRRAARKWQRHCSFNPSGTNCEFAASLETGDSDRSRPR